MFGCSPKQSKTVLDECVDHPLANGHGPLARESGMESIGHRRFGPPGRDMGTLSRAGRRIRIPKPSEILLRRKGLTLYCTSHA